MPTGLRGTIPEMLVASEESDQIMTNATTANAPRTTNGLTPSPATQKVVIVNGNGEIFDLLETVLDAGHYDVVLVESSAHAYSRIKLVRPNLVVLCMRIDDPEGFQVLSMLKLDEQTRTIPVLTYTTEYEGQEPEEESADTADDDLFVAKPAIRMN
jgi:CheY-like chemotaxis protein